MKWSTFEMNDRSGLSAPAPLLVVDLFPEILAHLLQLLSGLSAEDWEAPTVCSGWSVKDVGLHLLGVEIGNLAARRDQHKIGAAISSWDELLEYINRWNQEWVATARRISAPLLIQLLGFTGEMACEYFRSLDPFEIGGPISWAGPAPRPVWLDIAREYTERWHHQQHIRSAVGRPGLKAPRYLQPVLETFAWALPHTFRGVAAPDGACITLTVTGDSGGCWTLLREAGVWSFYRGRPQGPDTEIVLDEDFAWRLFTRGVAESEARRKVAVKGNRSLAEAVFAMVSIIA
jgi:uncharacterized protein (TIGR03083 family)